MGSFGVELGCCPQIRETKKSRSKGLCRKILDYYMAFTRHDLLFCRRNKLHSFLGGTNSDLGGHSLKIPARGTGFATFFGRTIIA